MDRVICEAEGEGVLSLKAIMSRVKARFPNELSAVSRDGTNSLPSAHIQHLKACDLH